MNEIDDIFSSFKSKNIEKDLNYQKIIKLETKKPAEKVGKKAAKKGRKEEKRLKSVDKEDEAANQSKSWIGVQVNEAKANLNDHSAGGFASDSLPAKDAKQAVKSAKMVGQVGALSHNEDEKDTNQVETVQVVTHCNSHQKRSNFKKILDQDDDGFFDSRGTKSNRKKTEEGFNIYHEDELKIGLGGDTEDCPFDCKCCF